MLTDRRKWFFKGMRDGISIMLGYFAVSIALGIAAKNAGMTAAQATVASALIMASAGQYIGFTLIAAGATRLGCSCGVALVTAPDGGKK